MSFFDKIRAFFSGKKEASDTVPTQDISATQEETIPQRETLVFDQAEIDAAAEANAQQNTRMTEEYKEFLESEYNENNPDDTLAWDSDYEEETAD